ncbi:hypothetical protein ABZ865_13415 [Streptomyces sp. NPDC047085]|uniref:WXG100 family type VII secretion target n=1 Tax=Streptomyces sp. NPDC047085 TaxID=3155140 RepID=UPI0033C9A2A5
MSDMGSRLWETVRQSRFLVQDPEQLWAMVESADGPTASALGDLLVDAAKTITEIGGDLRTHSLAVEWHGEGGDAFRTWCHQAALATLSLGDYSETAGKWLGHAADTLHEVKPQLEKLKDQSATARSVLDAHAAKATDVGNHDGGPSDSEVSRAKTQYANDGAEAGMLMMKLAQSYTASTERINSLEAPRFPELPEQFVPTDIRGDVPVAVPTTTADTDASTAGRKEPYARERTIGPSPGGTDPAPWVVTQSRLRNPADSPDAPLNPVHVTNTAVDSAETVPSTPAVHPSPSVSPVGPTVPDGWAPSTSGPIPPPFTAGPTLRPGVPEEVERPGYGGRGSLATRSGHGTSTGPQMPGRGVCGPFGPGMTGGQPGPVRGPLGSAPARGANGVTGGRPLSPTAGRPTGAIPRGNVIGGAPSQQMPVGRGSVPAGGNTRATPTRGKDRVANSQGGSKDPRTPARSGGIIGGQPRKSPQRGQAGVGPQGAGPARGTSTNASVPHGGGSRDASTSSPKRGERSAHDERSHILTTHGSEDGTDRPSTPGLRSGPDEHAQREG